MKTLFRYDDKKGREIVRIMPDGRAYVFNGFRVPRWLGEFVARIAFGFTLKFVYPGESNSEPLVLWAENQAPDEK
jgi:hypothetical protein